MIQLPTRRRFGDPRGQVRFRALLNAPIRYSLIMLVWLALSPFPAPAQAEPASNPLETEKGYLLTESGQWRTANPDYEPDSDQPRDFGINYRWGPHRKHIIGEIVGISEKGTAVYASVYIFFNPVTAKIHIDLIGWDGTFGPAEERRIDATHRVVEALLYQPNGTVQANRHTYELIDSDTYIIRVFEPDQSGRWVLKKEETWRQLASEDLP